MDRSRPRFRLFDLTDQPDGRPAVWHVVEVDNTPGRELSSGESAFISEFVAAQPWKDDFYAAFGKNKKATVYEPIPM